MSPPSTKGTAGKLPPREMVSKCDAAFLASVENQLAKVKRVSLLPFIFRGISCAMFGVRQL